MANAERTPTPRSTGPLAHYVRPGPTRQRADLGKFPLEAYPEMYAGGGLVGALGRIARHMSDEPFKKGIANVGKDDFLKTGGMHPSLTGVLESFPLSDKSAWGELIKRQQYSPDELAALEAYVANPAPFQPVRIRNQRAAIENAVARGHLSAKQAENMEATRKALDAALRSEIRTPSEIYRGLRDFDQRIRKWAIIGGHHPASFTHSPETVRDFTDLDIGEGSSTVIKVPGGASLRGAVIPAGTRGFTEHEVLLHPESRLEIFGIEKFDDGTLVRAIPNSHVADGGGYDISAWAHGGHVQSPLEQCKCRH